MADIMEMIRKKKQAIQQSSGRREKTTKPQPGKSRFRILPGWRGGDDPTFFQDFGQHFVKGVDGTLKAVYICTEKTFGKPCPVCAAIGAGINAADDDDVIKAMEESRAKGRILMNALHLNGDDPATPIILDLTPTTAEKVFDLMDEYGDITDLETGRGIVINRTGKGLNTKYDILPAAESDPVPASMLEKLHNLDKYVEQEYDEGKNKVLGAVSTVTGILPAPVASSADAPSTSADEGLDDVLEGECETVEAPAETVAEVKEAPVVAKADDDLSDDELDSLLDELG